MTTPPESIVEVYKAVYRLRRHLWTLCVGGTKDTADKNRKQSLGEEEEVVKEKGERKDSVKKEEKEEKKEKEGGEEDKAEKTCYIEACHESIRRCIFLLVGVAPATEGMYNVINAVLRGDL